VFPLVTPLIKDFIVTFRDCRLYMLGSVGLTLMENTSANYATLCFVDTTNYDVDKPES